MSVLKPSPDSSGFIKVICRPRPFETYSDLPDACINAITVTDSSTVFVSDQSRKNGQRVALDSVFPSSANQAELFEAVQPCVDRVLHGQDALIFAYGQTGSGKTHTMEVSCFLRFASTRLSFRRATNTTAALIIGPLTSCLTGWTRFVRRILLLLRVSAFQSWRYTAN